MYDDLSIGDAATQYLMAMEQELGRPIRLIGGGGRTRTLEHYTGQGGWSAMQRRMCGNATAADARDRGITIVSWGSLHTSSWRNITMPESLVTEDHLAIDRELYDVCGPEGALFLAEPWMVEDTMLGEIGERVFVTHFPFEGYTRGDYLDLDLLFAPVKACVDEEYLASFAERQAERNREQFAALLRRTSQEGLTKLEREINRLMAAFDQHQMAAARAKVDLRSKQSEFDVLTARITEAGDLDGIEDVWQKLHDHPKLKRVQFMEDQVILDTEALTIKHPLADVEAPLGEFRWTIGLDDGSFRIENLTNRKGNHDHPHVHEHRPCFGDMGNTIYTLVKQGKLDVAVEMVFVFLGSINMADDWGRRAQYWFDGITDTVRAA